MNWWFSKGREEKNGCTIQEMWTVLRAKRKNDDRRKKELHSEKAETKNKWMYIIKLRIIWVCLKRTHYIEWERIHTKFYICLLERKRRGKKKPKHKICVKHVYTFRRREVEGNERKSNMKWLKLEEKNPNITLMRLKVYWWPFGSYRVYRNRMQLTKNTKKKKKKQKKQKHFCEIPLRIKRYIKYTRTSRAKQAHTYTLECVYTHTHIKERKKKRKKGKRKPKKNINTKIQFYLYKIRAVCRSKHLSLTLCFSCAKRI